MSRTALVTGATGLLGSNLVHELARQGWRVTALARSRAKFDRLMGSTSKPCRATWQTSRASRQPCGKESVSVQQGIGVRIGVSSFFGANELTLILCGRHTLGLPRPWARVDATLAWGRSRHLVVKPAGRYGFA
jgi:NAD(P)-dependent dehydrogenase (short-subunit alcohol dehydrogenase family)